MCPKVISKLKPPHFRRSLSTQLFFLWSKNMNQYQHHQIVLLLAGNFCTLEGQSTSGQCIIISSCPVAVEGFRKGIRPQICGFQGAIPLVCCPTSGISPVKPTRVDITTPTTTTSTTTTRPIGTESVTKRPRNQYQPGELSLESKEFYVFSKNMMCVPAFFSIDWVLRNVVQHFN